MGEFANAAWVKTLAWGCAAVIVGLNLWLVIQTVGPWMAEESWRMWVCGPPMAAVLLLLGRVTFGGTVVPSEKHVANGAAVASNLPLPVYRRILVPLDHSDQDRAAVAHAAAMARPHGATLYILHIEEGVTSRLFGAESSTDEIRTGEEYFNQIVEALQASGLAAEVTIEHGSRPADAIISKARELQPDLIVMGAHGHRGLKDIILGNTINDVRHHVAAPVLVVGAEPGA